jgi:hypothetical protein
MAEELLIRIAGRNEAAGILACLASAFAPCRDSCTPQAFDDTVLTPAALARSAAKQSYLGERSREPSHAARSIGKKLIFAGGPSIRMGTDAPSPKGPLRAVGERLPAAGWTRISLATTARLQRAEMAFALPARSPTSLESRSTRR